MSRTPLTNLQLRNTRGDADEFEKHLGERYLDVVAQASMAAAAFPRCLALGLDMAISPDGRAWLLEANAFGDLLPGCLVDGWDTYRWQVEEMRNGYVSAMGL